MLLGLWRSLSYAHQSGVGVYGQLASSLWCLRGATVVCHWLRDLAAGCNHLLCLGSNCQLWLSFHLHMVEPRVVASPAKWHFLQLSLAVCLGPLFLAHLQVGAVVVGFDRYINYYKIQYATLCIRENPGCLFIATNRDAVTHLTDAQVRRQPSRCFRFICSLTTCLLHVLLPD
jgi:hypothetical protein